MEEKGIETKFDKLNNNLKEKTEDIKKATEKIRKINEKLDKFNRISTIIFLIVMPIMWVVSAVNLSKGTLSLNSYITMLIFTLCVIVDVYLAAKRKNTSINISIENIDGIKVEDTNI